MLGSTIFHWSGKTLNVFGNTLLEPRQLGEDILTINKFQTSSIRSRNLSVEIQTIYSQELQQPIWTTLIKHHSASNRKFLQPWLKNCLHEKYMLYQLILQWLLLQYSCSIHTIIFYQILICNSAEDSSKKGWISSFTSAAVQLIL